MEQTSTPPHTPWQARVPFFYGWVIVAVAFGVTFIATAPFWTIGVFIQPMQQDLGWSRSAILGAVTVRGVVASLAGPLAGAYLDRPGGARNATVLSGLLAAGTVLATYRVESELEFFLVFGVLGGIGSVIQNSALYGATVPKWFVRRRGTAVALVTMGSPVATMVLPSLFAGVIDADGWRAAWLVMGVLSILLAVLPGFLLVSQPEDVGLHPDGAIGRAAVADAAAARGEMSYTLGQAIRSPVFWILNLALALGSLPVAGLPANLVPLFTDRGIGRELAVLGFSTYGLLGLLGRIFWGYFINRRSITGVLIILGVYGTVVTPLIFLMQGDVAVSYAPIIAFGIGSYVSFNQLVWASYFGRKHLGAITGLARPFASVTSSMGPFLMAWLYDNLGSYDAGVHMMTAAWLLSTAALAWASTAGSRRSTPTAPQP